MASLELFKLLTDPTGLNLVVLPVLPVERRVDTTNVFTFTPRRVCFTREHDFFEDGDVHRHLYLQDMLTNLGEVQEKPKVAEFQCQTAGCSQVFDTLESYEHHYNTLHRNVCASCKRSFPSVRLLDIHILEWHDSLFQIMAEKANMYQCLVEGCQERFKTSADRKDHLIKIHLYPSDFRFDKPKKQQCKPKQRSPIKNVPVAMEVVSGDGLVVESMETCSSQGNQGSTENYSAGSARISSNPQNKNRVPSTICFGHGSARGFKHTKKKK
ncbi:zinc finger protein 511 [Bombina bombina]|uniref:zinc finger protein 511 n=1 Tax=Bombina bombina TaxID=8345 RepID=UPI00235B0B6E|nr:zinc finger protein 511 [Bombina bombina]